MAGKSADNMFANITAMIAQNPQVKKVLYVPHVKRYFVFLAVHIQFNR